MSEIKYFTYDEIKEILNMPMEWRTRALFAFQYASGCRIGELLPFHHFYKVMIKDKHKDPILDANGKKQYKEWDEVTKGLLKSNIKINEEEGIIQWDMPNFKTKNEAKKTKTPFILKEETFLWKIIKIHYNKCAEQVFNIRQSMARQLIREQIHKYAEETGKDHLKSHASHALRRSRGTHLAEIFDYDAYEIMAALGHSSLQSGVHYVATAQRKSKMRSKLKEMEAEK